MEANAGITRILRRDGYLAEANVTAEEIAEARQRWLADHPRVPPLYPSRLHPGEEARCTTCRDTGFVLVRHFDHGEMRTELRECSCQQARLVEESRERSGVPEPERRSFESFVPREGAAEAFAAAAELATGRATFKLLLIYGRPGNGKTHLAYSAVVEACHRGLAARYVYAPDFFQSIRAMYDGATNADPAGQWKRCPFLALDDLGAEHETDWTRAMLEEVIDYRYSHEMPTLCATNREPKNLPEPVLSRFTDGEVSKLVLNTATSYRPKKGAK